MISEPDRRPSPLAVKLDALVRGRWGTVGDTAELGSLPGGASLVDRAGGRTWALLTDSGETGAIEGNAERRVGAALALAHRAATPGVHLITEDADAAGVVARRASLFAPAPTVWRSDGPTLHQVAPVPAAATPVPAPGAELYRPVLREAGLTPVVEGGVLIGEYLGLEVGRVIAEPDGTAHLEAGVGRIDREAGSVVWGELGEVASLARVRDVVAAHRNPTAERHPLNQLVAERWLRSIVVAQPALAGAASLRPVGSALARRNLRETAVATAVGKDPQGTPVVVTCSTGVDLDLVPSAADDRLAHAPDARLVLVLPACDAVAITRDLASRLVRPAEVVTVAADWRTLTPSGAPGAECR